MDAHLPGTGLAALLVAPALESPDEALLARVLLEATGLRVREATGWEAAARSAAQAPPDVVLAHVDSGAAALEACRRLIAEPGLARVPLVLLGPTAAERDALVEAGAAGVVGRPLVPWQLDAQVRAALRLRRAAPRRDPAAEATERHRLWAGYLVHDLSNPLTIVGGALALAGSGPLTDRQASALATAREAHARVVRMVTALLDVERVEAGGRLRLVRSVLGVPALLAEVAAAVEPAVASRRCAVAVEAGGVATVDADRELLLRALVNLAENGARHAPPGSVLRLVAHPLAAGVRLGVLDAGPGVAPSDRTRIFERFQQGSTERSRGQAGLGLAFCRAVAESHGGRAICETSPEGGAAFYVDLPA